MDKSQEGVKFIKNEGFIDRTVYSQFEIGELVKKVDNYEKLIKSQQEQIEWITNYINQNTKVMKLITSMLTKQ